MQIEINVQIKTAWVKTTPSAVSHTVAPWASPEGLANSISVKIWQQWFCRWLEDLNPDLSPIQAYELTLRLTDDAEIQALNATYRQQNHPTDVLAFAALDAELFRPPADEQALELGDIVISVETALTQAEQQQLNPKYELAWLASHGLLHLLGWDHPDQASLEGMLTRQAQLLERIGLPKSLNYVTKT